MRLSTRIAIRWPCLGVPVSSIVDACAVTIMLAALVFILRFSVGMPYVDEWDLTHVVLGGMSLGEWTFTRLNEHLFIPGNALWFIVMKASGLSFRAGMILNWLLLSAAAMILMRAARNYRGFASIGDLVFPAVLLHSGHAYNLLMSYQIVFGCFILSAAWMLQTISAARPGDERRIAWRAAWLLLLLMINGGMGLALVPPLALWIGWMCFLGRTARPLPLLAVALGCTAYALIGARVGGESLPLDRLGWCVVQYLGMGLGLWYDGPHWPRNGLAVAAGYLVACGVLLARGFYRVDGGRSVGLLAFLIGHLAVALGIACSRGGGIAERYVTISAIGMAAVSLAFPSRWLAIPALVLIAINITPGIEFGQRHRAIYRDFETDLRAGTPLRQLREKHQKNLRVGGNLEPAVERLRRHGIKPFAE